MAPSLSTLEIKIIEKTVNGDSMRTIADNLGYSYHYIKHFFDIDHTNCIYRKIEGVSNKEDMIEFWVSSNIFNDLYPNALEKLEYTRRTGEAKAVANETSRDIRKLNKLLERNSIGPRRIPILTTLKPLLIANGIAQVNISSVKKGIEHLHPIIYKLEAIGKELNDEETGAYFYLLRSLRDYLRKDYKGAQINADLSIETSSIDDLYLKLMPDTLFTLSSGLRRDENAISLGEERLNGILKSSEKSSKLNEFQVFRVLGRAWGLMGKKRGVDLLSRAWIIYNELKSTTPFPFGATMIAKSLLDIGDSVKNISTEMIETWGLEGLEMAQLHEFNSYTPIIENKLELLLH